MSLTPDGFLAAPKELLRRRIQWRGKRRRDYVEARLGVQVIGNPSAQGRVILQAHRYRVPPKYTFALVFRAQCILRLDVEPGRIHINPDTLEVVRDTHWQAIPDLGHAVADGRQLIHRQWLNEFLSRSGIRAVYFYRPPPHGEQLLFAVAVMTLTIISPTELEAASRALINARRTNIGIEVTMPVIYPTGQMVTVVITVGDGDYLVHDAGQGAMCLTSAGTRLSAQLESRLAELARHYGCEFIDGRMSRYATESQLALAIAMVANASRTVGDQSIYVRRLQEGDFRKIVTDRVREVAGRRLRENEEVIGQSGRAYHVPNVVLDQNERAPVAFIIPLPARTLVPPHFAEFWDLHQRYNTVENDSVYDEASAFRQEDWNLLRVVSEIVPLADIERHMTTRGWTA